MLGAWQEKEFQKTVASSEQKIQAQDSVAKPPRRFCLRDSVEDHVLRKKEETISVFVHLLEGLKLGNCKGPPD